MSTVLVVDDDEGLLRLVEYTLQRAGHEVITTVQPETALRLAEQHAADAVVLDIMMPGRSGYDVLDDLRNSPKTAGIPILVLSALSDGPHRVKGLREGADDYMCKPLEPEELVLRLERLLAGGPGSSADLYGRLGAVSVVDVLQILLQLGKPGVLEVSRAGQNGHIILDGNAARAAAFGALAGKDAILAILSLKRGNFRFRQSSADEKNVPAEAISLQSTLFTGAWLDDELRRRRKVEAEELLWPASEDGGPPPTPEGFEALPLFRVWKGILDEPGLSLEKLLAGNIAAPRMVRLAVSLLAEHGALRISRAIPGKALETEAAEGDPGTVIERRAGEVMRAAVARGYRQELVHVLVVVEPSVHGALLEMRQGIPASALAAPGDSLIVAWHAGRVAALPISAGVGQLVVHLVSVDAERALDGLRGRLASYSAVAIWAEDAGEVPRTQWIVEEIETGAGQWWGLYIASERDVAAYVAALLDGSVRWRMHRQAASSMAELLTLLAAAAGEPEES